MRRNAANPSARSRGRAAFLALALATPAHAARLITIAFEPPTQYVDDSPISPGEIREYRVYCAANRLTTDTIFGSYAGGDIEVSIYSGPCALTVTAVTTWNVESEPSAPVQIPGVATRPVTGVVVR